MYVHLGDSRNIPEKEIIGIFNIKAKSKPCNRELIQHAFLKEIGDSKKYNSFIITTKKVFLSPIASITLYKRVMRRKIK